MWEFMNNKIIIEIIFSIRLYKPCKLCMEIPVLYIKFINFRRYILLIFLSTSFLPFDLKVLTLWNESTLDVKLIPYMIN